MNTIYGNQKQKSFKFESCPNARNTGAVEVIGKIKVLWRKYLSVVNELHKRLVAFLVLNGR
jgi:hypothetical protein